MKYFPLVACVVFLFVSCAKISRPQYDFVGKEDFLKFIDQYEKQIQAFDKKNIFKEKEYYRNQNWPKNERVLESWLNSTVDKVKQIYEFKESVYKYLFIDRKKERTLVILSVPQGGYWSYGNFLRILPKEIKDKNILFVDTSALLTNSEINSLKHGNMLLDKELKEIDIYNNQKDYLVFCTSSVFFEEFLNSRRKKEQGLAIYSPMVKEVEDFPLPNPSVFSDSKQTFNYEFLVYWYEGIVMDHRFIFPINSKLKKASYKKWVEMLRRFEVGINIPLGSISIISAQDKLISKANSHHKNFKKTYVMEDSDHLAPTQQQREIKKLLSILKQEFYR